MRPAQLGLRSSGGSIRDLRDPLAALRRRWLYARPIPVAGQVTGTGANCSRRVWLRLWYGSDPKSTAVAAARWLRAEPAVMIAHPVRTGTCSQMVARGPPRTLEAAAQGQPPCHHARCNRAPSGATGSGMGGQEGKIRRNRGFRRFLGDSQATTYITPFRGEGEEMPNGGERPMPMRAPLPCA